MNTFEAQMKLNELAKQKRLIEFEMAVLREQIAKDEAVEYIKKHEIKLADVILSSEGHFDHIREFRVWLAREERTRRWAEWNMLIYRTWDIIDGHFKPTPAGLWDLREMEGAE